MLPEETYRMQFVKFAKTHGRMYATHQVFDRLENFRKNVDFVLQHNGKEEKSYELGQNQFADWSLEEFDDFLLKGFRIPHNYNSDDELTQVNDNDIVLGDNTNNKSIPENLDWVEKGFLNPPRNQGSCGSCYAFATMGAIESRWGISKGKDKMKYLSPQMIIDCDASNYGCSGGFMPLVYRFLINKRGGMPCTDTSYPYKAHRGKCKTKCEAGAKIVSYRQITSSDEKSIIHALQHGPITVGIQGSSRVILNYKKGIITEGCSNSLNHAVLLVGYGVDSDSGIKYWKIRNSWSELWGESGNFRVKRGICGVELVPSYPIIG